MKNSMATIGLLLNRLDLWYQNSLWRTIAEAAKKRGLGLIVFPGGYLDPGDEGYERSFLYELAASPKIDAYIVGAATYLVGDDDSRLMRLIEGFSGRPIVSVSYALPGAPSILIDNRASMRAMTLHMGKAHGHQRIAFVRGPESNPESLQRLKGYREALAELGVAFDERLVKGGRFDQESGYRAALELVKSGREPEALVCSNDHMALGAIEAFRESGLRVPDDVAVSGFDDIEEAEAQPIGLSSVRQDFSAFAEAALDAALAAIEGRQAPPELILRTELVTRESCGCIGPDSCAISATSGEIAKIAKEASCKGAQGAIALQSAIARSTHPYCAALEAMEALEGEAGIGLARLSCLKAGAKGRALGAFKERKLLASLGACLESMHHALDLEALAKALGADPGGLGLGGSLIVQFGAMPEGRIPERAKAARAVEGSRNVMTLRPLLDLLPERVGAAGASDPAFIALPLCDMKAAYGYALIPIAHERGAILEILRVQLSQAMRTLQEIESLKKAERKAARALKDLAKANAELAELAIIDPMTGVLNRRGFFLFAERQHRIAMRKRDPLLVLYADLDGLKRINDGFGHSEGDAVIKAAAAVMKRTFRATDIIGRMGGDEFAVIALDSRPSSFEAMRERLLSAINEHNARSGKPYKLAMSIGHSHLDALEGAEEDLEGLLAIADAKLYEEKSEKRRARRDAEGRS
jgi:diguanylate cyclase (GGDEF)-like protein